MAAYILKMALFVAVMLLAAPVVGGFLSGTDRFFAARMQRRQGPPVLQPFYDLSKFFQKKAYIVNGLQHFLVIGHLLFLMMAIAIIYAGQDILLAIFSLTLAEMLLCIAAFSASAPYSNLSAQREMLQMACAEPVLLLICIGLYLSSGSFMVSDIVGQQLPAIVKTPGIFLAFLVVLPIELRKSPFDVSTSHHAHQEMVKGVTTDISGKVLGIVELSEWYELFLMATLIGLFFLCTNPISILPALAAALMVLFMMTLCDNVFPRVRWERMLAVTWMTTLVAGGGNMLLLMLLINV